MDDLLCDRENYLYFPIILKTTVLLIGVLTVWTVSITESTLAQDQPPRHVIAPQLASGATDVHSTDIDGDDHTDVLSASFIDNKIAWYKNNGSGSFREQRVISKDAHGAISVYAADLDGDGDQDVLSASIDDNKVAWYENFGDNFSEQKIVTNNADHARSVYASDIDKDGDKDILSASTSDEKISWYENVDGEGSFSVQKVITDEAGSVQTVYAEDLDGDGDMDVLSSARDNDKVMWYENIDGQGSFSEQKTLTTNADGARSVYAADLDGDGDQDVLSASSGDDKVAWYENDGSGSFSEQKVITTSDDGAHSVYAADVDGDGDLDVLSASSLDDKVALYENQIGEGGDGSDEFGGELVVSTNAISAKSVHTGDLDGDGDKDILSASQDDAKIAWYENQLDQGDGFGTQQVIVPLGIAEDAQSVHAADLDGDGDQDVLSASSGDDKIAWYENTGGSFSAQKTITTNAHEARSVHAADLTGDGDQDVVSGSQSIAWHENNGGSFSSQKVITTSIQEALVFASDIDGDGDQDILSASGDGDKIAWHENTGESFSDQKIITTDVNNAQSIYAVDLNGDGDTDVLSASSLDDKIAWYENTDGDGSFSSQRVISTNAEGAQSAYAADLDEDGDMDVISTSVLEIAWYENSTSFGSTSFSSAKTISSFSTGAPSDVRASDLDGDGDQDVLSGMEDQNRVAWYENTGGSFSSRKIIGGGSVKSVYDADLDGDGDTDVLEASSFENKIVWYENTSTTIPVELVDLTAHQDDNTSLLYWKTASEQNNAGFEIHRKVYAGWNQVGYVESKASGGTTTETKSYRFTDADLPYDAGRLTYRLRQVDTDGTTTLSDSVVVVRGVSAVELLGTFPNPASQQATLRYALPAEQDIDIRLYDTLGRQVRTIVNARKEGRHEETIDLSGLPSGTYFLRLQAGNAERSQQVTVVR